MLPIRLVAAFIAVLSVLPLWRILPQRATGLAGAATAEAAASYSGMIWYGLIIAAIPGVVAAVLIKDSRLERWLARAAAPLARAGSVRFAAVIGMLAAGVAAIVAVFIMAGSPTLIDSFAQLTQARYIASAQLAGPLAAHQQAWHIPQTLFTDNGWVSQYPPGYAALLGIGMRLNAVALVGPVLFGIAAFFTALIADEVIENRALARTAAVLAALSAFMIAQAGAFMSHVPAAAFSTAALYFVLRGSRTGASGAAFAAGASIGALFAIRPLSAVVAGVTATLYVLLDRRPLRARARQLALSVAGALPFLVLIGFYNAHFFGSATTFGYDAALGPAAGLGFGQDPWGNAYGPLEALAYTSAELSALSVFLLETPLPLVTLVGVFFALSTTLRPQVRLLFWWVAALVLAYLFYWHHGLFMGPRMLADTGTLWVLLVVIAVAGLVSRIAPHAAVGRYSVRTFALGAVSAAFVIGVLLMTPARLLSYAPPADVLPLLRAPRVDAPALIFVHGGWSSRIAARLAAKGMRADSIETALRQNSTCSAHDFSLQYPHVDTRLDFTPRATALPKIAEISQGNRIRIADGERMHADCMREIAADTAGVVDIAPYSWQGALPGQQGGPLFVRDMGPQPNQAVIAAHPGRRLMLLTASGADGVKLYSYEDGMQRIWRTN